MSSLKLLLQKQNELMAAMHAAHESCNMPMLLEYKAQLEKVNKMLNELGINVKPVNKKSQ